MQECESSIQQAVGMDTVHHICKEAGVTLLRIKERGPVGPVDLDFS